MDYYISGKEVVESFYWYFLDMNCCVIKIVYEFLKNCYKILELKNVIWLEFLVEMVNFVDIWDM